MKALSGYAEWFWLMAKHRVEHDGWKDVENRNWSLPHAIAMYLPQRIYLHASKKPTTQEELIFISTLLTSTQWDEFVAVKWDNLRGCIIGKTTITRQMRKFQYTEADHVDCGSQQRETSLLANDASRSKWFFGKFGFVVCDGELLDNPIPYKGQLGFFEVNLNE